MRISIDEKYHDDYPPAYESVAQSDLEKGSKKEEAKKPENDGHGLSTQKLWTALRSLGNREQHKQEHNRSESSHLSFLDLRDRSLRIRYRLSKSVRGGMLSFLAMLPRKTTHYKLQIQRNVLCLQAQCSMIRYFPVRPASLASYGLRNSFLDTSGTGDTFGLFSCLFTLSS